MSWSFNALILGGEAAKRRPFLDVRPSGSGSLATVMLRSDCFVTPTQLKTEILRQVANAARGRVQERAVELRARVEELRRQVAEAEHENAVCRAQLAEQEARKNLITLRPPENAAEALAEVERQLSETRPALAKVEGELALVRRVLQGEEVELVGLAQDEGEAAFREVLAQLVQTRDAAARVFLDAANSLILADGDLDAARKMATQPLPRMDFTPPAVQAVDEDDDDDDQEPAAVVATPAEAVPVEAGRG